MLCLEVLKWLPSPKCNMGDHLEHSANAATQLYNQWFLAVVSLNSALSSIIQFFNDFPVYRQYCQMF